VISVEVHRKAADGQQTRRRPGFARQGLSISLVIKIPSTITENASFCPAPLKRLFLAPDGASTATTEVAAAIVSNKTSPWFFVREDDDQRHLFVNLKVCPHFRGRDKNAVTMRKEILYQSMTWSKFGGLLYVTQESVSGIDSTHQPKIKEGL
jgi:hypothetical protein